MTEMKMVRRCLRCGAPIQSDDPSAEGYLPLGEIPQDEGSPLFCLSCLKETSWHELPSQSEISNDYLNALSAARKKDALFVYIVDLFSFECSFVPAVAEVLDGARLLVLANKRDLLPDLADEEHLTSYVAHRFHVAGFKSVSPQDVRIVSLSFNIGIADAMREIEERRAKKDVCLLGAKGSGKSLFVDLFLSSYENKSSRPIASRRFPGSDELMIDVPLPHASHLYDTPGFPLDNSFYGHLDELPKGLSLDAIGAPAPQRMAVENKGALFIGLLARLETRLAKRSKAFLTAYIAKGIDLKPIPAKRSIGALFDKYIEKKALKPRLKRVSSSLDFDAFEYVFGRKETRDFGIAGIGWVSFEGEEGDAVRVYVPKGIGVYTSRPKLGKGK